MCTKYKTKHSRSHTIFFGTAQRFSDFLVHFMLILRCNRKLSGLVARLNSFFCDLTHLFLGMVKMFSFALRSLSKGDLQVKQVLVKTLIKAPDLQAFSLYVRFLHENHALLTDLEAPAR